MHLDPEHKKLPDKLMPFVWRYLKNKKWYLAGSIFVALVWAIEMSLSPYLLKVIIDTVVLFANNPAKILTTILLPALLYGMMSIILQLNFSLYYYINLKLYPDMKSAVDKDMFGYLLDHSYAFFQNTFAGNLTKKIADMAENIEPLISIPNGFFTRFFAAIIASFTLFTVVQPIFGIILFVWTILFVSISFIAAKG
jgi:ATP-binding cassette subfamily B protein